MFREGITGVQADVDFDFTLAPHGNMTRVGDCLLASATDDAYAAAASVALLSAATLAAGRVPCLLIDCGIADVTKAAVHRTFAEYDVPLICRPVDVADFADLPLAAHLTLAAYARLMVPYLAHDLGSRTLYLDADTLTLSPIDQLLAVDLRECPAAAVQDPFVPFVSSPGGVAGWRRLGVPPAMAQFNSGVMLIDNSAWRAGKVTEQALTLLREYPDEATFADQGALNAVLSGGWIPLDHKWNVPVPRSAAVGLLGHVASRHSIVKVRDLAIVHFLGNVKPWQPEYAPSAYRQMYVRAYRRFAPFCDVPNYWNVLRWALSRP
jgi:lipopolysaccharide biosynthesis glycosyltransferase